MAKFVESLNKNGKQHLDNLNSNKTNEAFITYTIVKLEE